MIYDTLKNYLKKKRPQLLSKYKEWIQEIKDTKPEILNIHLFDFNTRYNALSKVSSFY